MSKLVDKISSDYFEARNSLNKSQGEIVFVHVENEDDRPFWKDIFSKMGIKTKIFPASKDSLNRGKTEVLKLKDKVGKYMVLCVDSDCDYLLQNKTETSRLINDNPYIFQTYAYSIENYKCFSESLPGVVIKSTLQDNPELFDIPKFLEDYSNEVFELFLYSYHLILNKLDEMTISSFSNTIKLLKQVDILNSGTKAIADLRNQINAKLSEIQTLSTKQLEIYEEQLKQLGITRKNTYLFIQGHTLYDNVVCMFLRPIESQLKKEHFNRINQQKRDDAEAKNRMAQYKKSIVDIELVLRNNTDYANCFLMSKIISDIDYFQKMEH